jgi:YggT family protein
MSQNNLGRAGVLLPCPRSGDPTATARSHTKRGRLRRAGNEATHRSRTEGKQMIALLEFIAQIITLYMWVVIISVLLSWLIAFNVINRHNQVVYMIADTMQKLTEPALRPIRNILPDFGALDLSPIVLILGLVFLRNVVIYGFLMRLFV